MPTLKHKRANHKKTSKQRNASGKVTVQLQDDVIIVLCKAMSAAGSCFSLLSRSVINEVRGLELSTWMHTTLGYRVVFASIPGPLCTANFVFATEPDLNSKGIPHVLEHMVFLGSKNTPYRGYLDLLASRCLTPGTNAYTAEDHTCFSVTSAGPKGLASILPAFMENLIHPVINDDTFLTEIYHVDGKGACCFLFVCL